MTIEAKQICDGCGAERELLLRNVNGPVDIQYAAKTQGWREPRQDQHLCPACIDKALEGSKGQKEATDAAE